MNYSTYNGSTAPVGHLQTRDDVGYQYWPPVNIDCDMNRLTFPPSCSTVLPSTSRPVSRTPSRSSSQTKKPKARISRPPNAFLLFRSDLWANEKQKATPIERDHRDISRIAAHCWKHLVPATKQLYHDRASKLREKHRQLYPDYKYAPARTTRASPRKSKTSDEENARCAHLASMIMPDVVDATRPMPEVAQPVPKPVPRQMVSEEWGCEQQASSVDQRIHCDQAPLDWSQYPSTLQSSFMSADDREAMIYQVYGCSVSELQEWWSIFRTAA